jgi:hypothetical protein
MTEEMTKLEALQNKLCNICDENALTYRFHREGYPIQLVIRPDESPSGQLSMLEVAGQGETGYISQDAAIVFEMDGPVYRIMRIGNCAPRRWVPAMPDGFATFDQAQAALNQLAQEKGWAEWRQ